MIVVVLIQCNLSKLNRIDRCSFYTGQSKQRFLTLRLYLKFGIDWCLFYTGQSNKDFLH